MRGAATERYGQPYAVRAGDIAGHSVRNLEGDDLGKIDDVVIDTSRGCIAYAALSFGGFLGLGDKLFAIPWEALRYSASDDVYVLDVPKERLEHAEGFDKDHWPDAANREWLRGMYSHYGYEPYWERR
jgi:sporulation protein YlmC with PRC-barrel domain